MLNNLKSKTRKKGKREGEVMGFGCDDWCDGVGRKVT